MMSLFTLYHEVGISENAHHGTMKRFYIYFFQEPNYDYARTGEISICTVNETQNSQEEVNKLM